MRQMDNWSFLVKFPPHIDVADVAGYPGFNLAKEGCTVKVEVWNGDLDMFAAMQEVWVQLRLISSLLCLVYYLMWTGKASLKI